MIRRSSRKKSEEVEAAAAPVEPNGVVEGAIKVDPPPPEETGEDSPSPPASPSSPASSFPSMPEVFDFIPMNWMGDIRYMPRDPPSEGHKGVIDTEKLHELVRKMADAHKSTIEDALQTVAETYVKKGRTVDEVKELYYSEDNIHSGEYSWRAAVHTIKQLLCPICQLFDCPLHPHMLGNFEFRATPRNEEDDLEPCNKNCFKHRRSMPKIPARAAIPQDTVDNLLRNLHRFGQLYCLYSVKGMRCAEVKGIMTRYFPEDIKKQAEDAAVKRETVPKVTLISRIKKKFAGIGRRHMPNQWYPCHCTENCGPSCDCNQAHNFCEDICYCPLSCPNRFPGCNCKKGKCDADSCPCYLARRECDRNLCGDCGAAETTGPPEQRKGTCRNFQISRQDYKPIVVGKSNIAGNGCFITIDGVKPGDLVCEYVGEVIPHDEAELRGEVYDKMRISYLFKLNNDYSIDAYYKGNTIRFANHSKYPNMSVRVVRVKGFDRIGLYASRPLVRGEELLFDYLYDKPQTEQYVPKDRVPPPAAPAPAPAAPEPAAPAPAAPAPAASAPAAPAPAAPAPAPMTSTTTMHPTD